MHTKRALVLNYVKIVVGAALTAVGFQFFTFPNDIVAGGVSGVCQILNLLLGLPVGVMIVVINIPLFLAAWKSFGKGFLIGSLVGMLASSLTIDLFALLPVQVTNDTLLAAVYGGLIKGVGFGLVYTTGATTGGVDIVAKYLRRRYPYVNFGTIILGLDVVVILAFAIIFQKYDSCMYTVITMFISSRVVDLMLYGTVNSNVCYIISANPDAISTAVTNRLHRGATLLHGDGAWSHEQRTVILTVIKRQQIVELKRLVRELDPQAFVIVSDSHEVFGKGFSDIARIE